MSEPAKENPKTSKRSKRRPAMEPLGWDEIVSQPGMGGYLSFLNGPVPLPHLQAPAPALAAGPGVVPHAGAGPEPAVHSRSDDCIQSLQSFQALILNQPQIFLQTPDIVSALRSETIPGIAPRPGVVSTPVPEAAPEATHAVHCYDPWGCFNPCSFIWPAPPDSQMCRYPRRPLARRRGPLSSHLEGRPCRNPPKAAPS